MGLDMYLTASANLLDSEGVEIEGLDAGGMEIAAVEYRAGYWRKANAVHGRWIYAITRWGWRTASAIIGHLITNPAGNSGV